MNKLIGKNNKLNCQAHCSPNEYIIKLMNELRVYQ